MGELSEPVGIVQCGSTVIRQQVNHREALDPGATCVEFATLRGSEWADPGLANNHP